MNVWKAILAAVVIFLAGGATGVLTLRLYQTQHVAGPRGQPKPGTNRPWLGQNSELLKRMEKDLRLTAEQRAQAEKILGESRERMRQLWERIAPESRQEWERMRRDVVAILQPEQARRFEEMMKETPRRFGGLLDHKGTARRPGDRDEVHRDVPSPGAPTPAPGADPK